MPLTEHTDIGWPYPLLEVTESKRTSRVGVPQGSAYELIGVDGNHEGGLRPFPGFLMVRELDFLSLGDTNHDLTSTVVGMASVNFRVSSDGYAFGFVYSVVRKVSTLRAADVFIDYWNSKTQVWVTSKVMDNVDPDKNWDAVHAGRFVFVFVQGRSPAMLYVNSSNVLVVLGKETAGPFPGPGKQPKLVSPEKAEPLGAVVTTDTNRPGTGQVVLLNFSPSEVGLGLGDESGTDSSGHADEQLDVDARLLEPGDYTFAYVLNDSRTGRRSALSEVAQARKEDFLYNTGAASSSGDDDYVDLYAAIEICYDSSKYDQAFIYRSVRVQDAGGTFVSTILYLDRIITLAEYHTSNNPLAGDLRQSIYYYELQDKQLAFQDVYLDRSLFDEQMPNGGAALFYESTMLVGNIENPSASSSEITRSGDAQLGLGEIRWSSLIYRSPELFPPQNRYVPNVPSNDAICLREVASNVIGFSIDRQYFLRKDSIYIRAQQIHEGFGIVGPRAADTVGSLIYFVTPKGLKAVDANAALDDVRSLNYLFLHDWVGDLSAVSLAYDPTVSAVFIHHPTQKHTACLWFNTAKVTELHDTPFLEVRRGVWPSNPLVMGSDLVERALFLQDAPAASIAGWKPRVFVVDNQRSRTVSGAATGNGNVRRTMMDVTGDVFFKVVSLVGTTLTINAVGYTLGSRLEGATIYVIKSGTGTLEGGKATIVKKLSATTLQISGTGLAGVAANDIVGISPVYFRWVGSPLGMLTEEGVPYEGANFNRVRHVDSITCAFTDVESKIETLAGSILTVSRWRALLYRGAALSTPHFTAYPTTIMGAGLVSVMEGEAVNPASFKNPSSVLHGKHGVDGTCLIPGMDIFVPDVDFRLLEARVSGEVRAAMQSRRPS